jgi:hypothetical protein
MHFCISRGYFCFKQPDLDFVCVKAKNYANAKNYGQK